MPRLGKSRRSQPSLWASQDSGPWASTLSPVVNRYRCAACGNVTRFDVTVTRRTREFHHYTLGGDRSVDDVELVEELIEAVTCRWCGHGQSIEELGATETPATG